MLGVGNLLELGEGGMRGFEDVGESRFSSSSLVMWSTTYLALSIMLVIDMVYLFSS